MEIGTIKYMAVQCRSVMSDTNGIQVEERTVVDKAVLDVVGEDIKCDGERVWYDGRKNAVEVESFAAALDAIEAGAESVTFNNGELRIEEDTRSDDPDSAVSAKFVYDTAGDGTRYTYISYPNGADLRDLMAVFE